MKLPLIAALVAFTFATSAAAQPLPALTLYDLDGGRHSLPNDWRAHGGVLVLGFAHDARDAMDHWASSLGLNDNDAWIEAPVVGDVNTMIRPMIRTGMRSRYTPARRLHVAPVFEGADSVQRLASPRQSDVVVLVIDESGQIIARADGPAQAADVARLRAALHP